MSINRITFPAPVRVYPDRETGAEIVIREPEWFDKRIEEMISDIKHQSEITATLPNAPAAEDIERIEATRIALATAAINTAREKHAKAYDKSKLYDYQIAKPTYGESQKARHAARIVNDDGKVLTDIDKLVDELIMQPGVVLDSDGSQVKVGDISCRGMVEELKSLLYVSLASDDRQLPN